MHVWFLILNDLFFFYILSTKNQLKLINLQTFLLETNKFMT